MDVIQELIHWYYVVPCDLSLCHPSEKHSTSEWYQKITHFMMTEESSFEVVCSERASTSERNFEVALARAIKDGICRFD